MNRLVVVVKNFASYSCNNRIDPKADPTETRIKVLHLYLLYIWKHWGKYWGAMGIAQGLPLGLGEEGGFPKRKGQCAGWVQVSVAVGGWAGRWKSSAEWSRWVLWMNQLAHLMEDNGDGKLFSWWEEHWEQTEARENRNARKLLRNKVFATCWRETIWQSMDGKAGPFILKLRKWMTGRCVQLKSGKPKLHPKKRRVPSGWLLGGIRGSPNNQSLTVTLQQH